MPEFWLDINYVGFKKVFITGRVPGDEDFEQELTDEQRKKLEDFSFKQQQELQDFLEELVL